MAKRNIALAKAEKALSGARKRATDLRRKIKSDQPIEIAATVGGGYIAGYVDKETPEWISGLGLDNPSLYIGIGLAAYGVFSSRSGRMETISTALGTGMVTAYAYTLAKEG